MTRTVIASNRLPVTLTVQGEDYVLKSSAGGLATAMRRVHASGDSRWVGYVGDTKKLTEPARARLSADLADRRLVPVTLTASDVSLYYDGYSNGVIWPLFHYLIDKVRLDATNEWRAYRAVNERFATTIAAVLGPGDTLWVHDYQLLLVPGLVRKLREDVRIGFFLHVPFPASDVFRILPHRVEILESLLASDSIGFHTEDYRHNFIHSAAKVLGVDIGVDTLSFLDRSVRVGVYPIGIDVERFERTDERVAEARASILAGTVGKRRMLGVDRLDYTKGVPRKLLAIDRLLEREPKLRQELHFVQLAVPTRERIDAYSDLRRQVNELVGRINSHYGSAISSPVQLLYRTVTDDELLALYRTADVMTVTPLRDGMNLVAKEYVASRTADDGVLLLSEFAGAMAELDAALVANPYDLGALADAMRRALFMPAEEQALRMRRLRHIVRQGAVDIWAKHFMEELSEVTVPAGPTVFPSSDDLDVIVADIARRAPRILLLDYDGTLVPIESLPELATPDKSLLDLLATLARLPETETHVLSGRSRETLTTWLGRLPIWLHAEHGFWSRAPEKSFVARLPTPDFLPKAEEIMTRHARLAPGAFVEPKSASIAFHFRNADPLLADVRLRGLRSELDSVLGKRVDILEGHKIIEARIPGVTKASVVKDILERDGSRPLLFGAGDDRTDEDLFAVFGRDDVSVRVGPGASCARYRVRSPAEVRHLLTRLAEALGDPIR